jgi:aminoglycoside phosphotransferase (APT) family kinase protein
MVKINQEELKSKLEKILNVEEIRRFKEYPSGVNTLLQFEGKKQKFMIKILTLPTNNEIEEARLNKEGKILKLFSNHETLKVPVPEMVYFGNDEKLIGYKFIIYKFVEGKVCTNIWNELTQEDRKEIVKQLGKIYRDIHQVKYESFGMLEEIFEGKQGEKSYEKNITDGIENYIKALTTNELISKELLEKVKDFVAKNVKKMKYKPKPTLIHNDLHLANIIVNKNKQGKYDIKAIVDWEWAEADNSLFDLFYTRDTCLNNKELAEIFFLEYFQGKRKSLNDFDIDYKIYNIISALDTAVYIWPQFPPTKQQIKETMETLYEQIK